MGSIAIVGLEFDDRDMLDAAAIERLRGADTVVIVSSEHAAAGHVRELGIEALTYSDLGLPTEAPAGMIVEALLGLAEKGDVALVSGGYPFVQEGVISGILARAAGGVDVFPIASPLQVLVLALDIDLTADVDFIDADTLAGAPFRRDTHLIVTGVRNAIVARAVGMRLLEFYASEHTIVTAGWLDGGGFDLELMTVDELTRIERVHRDTAIYVSPSRIVAPEGFDELVRIIAVLRGPDGCPWDREQTHESLGKHLIEEAYETLAAIEAGDSDELADELGDVLLQVVLHSQIAAEEDRFAIEDVIARITAKIRRRHPHIFGNVKAETSEQVMRNWDTIKRGEKERDSILSGVAPTLPALMYAQKISRRAAGAGFDWEDIDGVWAKVHEEIDELKATDAGSPEAADEVGDLLFTVVNVARKLGVDAEDALRRMCVRFERRFGDMERAVAERGADFHDLDLDEMEELWQQAKHKESANGGK
ncbi:MAG: nucleoside triphosphate pyrophosphohydrolase [Coriobacteriia bacterium]|nr:nucleoside triphosphate pyrophosphohydrolase [Coriobacteriia bacterium]